MQTTRLCVLICGSVAAASLLVSAEARQSARDTGQTQAPAARTGAASIAGVVMTDGNPGQPLRRVTVTVTAAAGAYGGRMTVTDDAGRFAFENLSAGRHLVSASKPAYLTTAYGVSRPLRPGSVPTGTAIALEPGQRLTNVVIRMTRGGVISGTVRDERGQPARDAAVALTYFRRNATGQRSLSSVQNSQTRTDGRGMYRIFGVPPGDYLVVSQLPFGLTDFERTTDADLQRLADPNRGFGLTSPSTSGIAPRRPTYGYAAVFYPGTARAADATIVSLQPGEERRDIDFRMQLVPMVRVEGVVSLPDGQPASEVPVWFVSSGTGTGGIAISTTVSVSDASGSFRMLGLEPGTYTLEVRPTTTQASLKLPFYGATEVVVSSAADVRVNLTLQPAITVTGRVALESASVATLDYSRVRIALTSETTSGLAIPVSANGQFTTAPVMPGRYRVSVTLPAGAGTTSSSWFVKSATIAGQDALDNSADIRPGSDVTDAVVTLTDRPSELSGTIQDGAGRPAPEYFIVAFPATRSLWTWGARRIQQTRPASDGKFVFRLPPGEYLIGAVIDVEQNEWFEPAFLESLLGASIKVTLAEGEKKVQHIRLR